ncbi:hypothetical protein JQ632_27435 [Bradyrhizobium liaoningense]|nr:hypothetical protein [Bradyrhizobium liaoningense]
MKQMSLSKVAIATSTFAFATLLSFDWCEQRGVSLSVESAQARIGRPLTPLSVAGVARRQSRRAAYGYGVVGAGLGAAAIGTAAAVGAATSPYGYYRGGPHVDTAWGYPGNYYSSYGYPGGYYYGGTYAAGGYPVGYYGGGYANRSYVTGRPTLFPRYYGDAYAAGGYPAGYYGGGYANRSYVTGRPTLFPRYYGGWNW